MRVRCRSTSGLDGVSGSLGNLRTSNCDLKRMLAVRSFPLSMDGRLSNVSLTCASAGAAPSDSMTITADTHAVIEAFTSRGGELLIDRSPRADGRRCSPAARASHADAIAVPRATADEYAECGGESATKATGSRRVVRFAS